MYIDFLGHFETLLCFVFGFWTLFLVFCFVGICLLLFRSMDRTKQFGPGGAPSRNFEALHIMSCEFLSLPLFLYSEDTVMFKYGVGEGLTSCILIIFDIICALFLLALQI